MPPLIERRCTGLPKLSVHELLAPFVAGIQPKPPCVSAPFTASTSKSPHSAPLTVVDPGWRLALNVLVLRTKIELKPAPTLSERDWAALVFVPSVHLNWRAEV